MLIFLTISGKFKSSNCALVSMAMKEDGAVFRVDGMIVITLELGKVHKKVKLGPDGSNKFRILLGRIGSTRPPEPSEIVRNHLESFGIVVGRFLFVY